MYDNIPYGKSTISYTSPTGKSTTLYGIGVLANALGRTTQTVRKWEIGGIIPVTPFKQGNKRLYSQEHIDAIVNCAEKYQIKAGKSIAQTAFVRHVYKEFDRLNHYFFDTEETINGIEEDEEV